MTPKAPFFLGLDVGGTKLAAGVADAEGRLLARDEMPAGARDGPEAVIERLVGLSGRVMDASGVARSGIVATGVGCGGPLDPVAGIVREPPNLPGWHDVPLLARLREGLPHPLGERPLYLENDANAAALGEHRYGAGRGVDHLVYLTISTGIGGGIIADGRLVRGENGNAAEIGHMSVAHDGWPCPCGSRGCLEAFCSGTNIAARARSRLLAGEASRLGEMWPTTVTARDVAEAARAGDPLAVRVWEDTTAVLGAGVANVINLMNPRLVILGGGVTRAGEQLLSPVRRIALERAFPYLASVADVVLAQLGPDTGVVGAVAVAQARLVAETEVGRA